MSRPRKEVIDVTERAIQMLKGTPEPKPVEGTGLPDADDLADEQHERALARLHEEKADYARFSRLKLIHEMTGSFAPEEIIFIAADVEDGKSLLCQNLFDDLTADQELVALYIGTEQSPEVLKIKLACIRCGIRQRLVLKPTPEEIAAGEYARAQDILSDELERLNSPEMRQLAFFATTDYVNRVELQKWIDGGVRKYGVQIVIVDHIDQMDHGPGKNAPGELTATVQLIHTLARKHKMPIIVASQISRNRDPIRRHSPPDKHDLAGASGKERIMAIGIGLWRPLRMDLTIEELREIKQKAFQGRTGQDKIYEKNTMGVRLLKDRLGDVPGKQCFLHVGKGGRLEDDEGMTHGIRTGGLS